MIPVVRLAAVKVVDWYSGEYTLTMPIESVRKIEQVAPEGMLVISPMISPGAPSFRASTGPFATGATGATATGSTTGASMTGT